MHLCLYLHESLAATCAVSLCITYVHFILSNFHEDILFCLLFTMLSYQHITCNPHSFISSFSTPLSTACLPSFLTSFLLISLFQTLFSLSEYWRFPTSDDLFIRYLRVSKILQRIQYIVIDLALSAGCAGSVF